MVVPATYIKLIRGTKLLYINEYTFFNSGGIGAGGFRYTCSSYLRRKCRAFAHVSRDDVILKMSNDHNHPPTKYMRTASGTRLLRINDYTYFKNCALRDGGSKYLCSSKISKQCKAYIHVSKDDIILKVGAKYISTLGGTKLLLLNNYTFSRSGLIGNGGSRYKCSSNISKYCQAYAHVSKNDVILKASYEHNHNPPVYTQLASGFYVKIAN
ncbi:hypothetical protein MSG28_008229 [Choristoneura fumiferana]|uniref:Uncharacterized protein n=1 Tax=Choristoneura fumiferana TaxID=7141 RepID=A0ACC0JAK1_CHOFU|nr:hypothetical protein MSG28_008229 [Choristoneura fumiferana]